MDSATATVITTRDLPPERRDSDARLDQKSTAPLWEVLGKIIRPSRRPRSCRCCGTTTTCVRC